MVNTTLYSVQWADKRFFEEKIVAWDERFIDKSIAEQCETSVL